MTVFAIHPLDFALTQSRLMATSALTATLALLVIDALLVFALLPPPCFAQPSTSAMMLVFAILLPDIALTQSNPTELSARTVMLAPKLILAKTVSVLEATLSLALSLHLATSLVFACPSMEPALILALQRSQEPLSVVVSPTLNHSKSNSRHSPTNGDTLRMELSNLLHTKEIALCQQTPHLTKCLEIPPLKSGDSSTRQSTLVSWMVTMCSAST
mmetsp:Transcript_22874/g.31900  ORF Transcript_22874/g.31900 Transcript_22874/m.31900 type:complete len:215 (+) Transcript_22874:421-1065(+)